MDTQAAQTAPTQIDSAMPTSLPMQVNAPIDPSQTDTAIDVAAQQSLPQDLNAVVSAMPQAISDAATAAANDSLNPANATSARGAAAKEQAVTGVLESLANELPGAQSVEQERTPEISPELESWMERIENHEERPPEKIVVADNSATNPTGIYAAEPVIVLPLTQSGVQQGIKHPVTDSVKWLATWCVRVMKKFHGSVVYRPLPSETQPGK